MADYIPYQKLINELDVVAGDVVYVASNTVRLNVICARNRETFDPNKFIESIQNKIGEEGTLLFPAFNFSVKRKTHFNPRKTKPATGALAECAFQRPDFKRTQNPLHSFLVWGKHADELMELNNNTSFGADSPFGFLHDRNAKMLAIDLDMQHSNSQAHYVEETMTVPYRKWKTYVIEYETTEGTEVRRYKLYHKKLGWVNDLTLLEPKLYEAGISRLTTLNGIRFAITRLGDADRLQQELIQKGGLKYMAKFRFDVYCKQVVKKMLRRPTI